MGKNKLKRWEEISEFGNVFEYTDYVDGGAKKPKGTWREIFGNSNPIVVELACGKGEYTLNLAERYPDKNFIGIDIKGARIWVGAKKALMGKIENVRFIRMFIDHIEDYFAAGEIDEIWITFPDPYLKGKKTKKRLTSKPFLERYRRVLKREGTIHLKTDSDSLFQFTLEVLEEEKCNIVRSVKDVYVEAPQDSLLTIQTYYEKRHLRENKVIKYLSFTL